MEICSLSVELLGEAHTYKVPSCVSRRLAGESDVIDLRVLDLVLKTTYSQTQCHLVGLQRWEDLPVIVEVRKCYPKVKMHCCCLWRSNIGIDKNYHHKQCSLLTETLFLYIVIAFFDA